jgi:hypothetical protein
MAAGRTEYQGKVEEVITKPLVLKELLRAIDKIKSGGRGAECMTNEYAPETACSRRVIVIVNTTFPQVRRQLSRTVDRSSRGQRPVACVMAHRVWSDVPQLLAATGSARRIWFVPEWGRIPLKTG